MYKEKILSLLKSEMGQALGVTEPAAIALASCKAYEAVGGKLKKIKVTTDPGVFKNGFSCGIPGTDEMGNEIAAILGVLSGNSKFELKVLENIKEEEIIKAKKLREDKIVQVDVKKGLTKILIDAVVITDKGVGRAVIKDKHTNIVLVEADGKIKYKSEEDNKIESNKDKFSIIDLKLADFINFINEIEFEDIKFTLEAIKVNKKLAEKGINGAGMGLGKAIYELEKEQKISGDIISYAQMLTGYAVDARMGGCSKPAMTICGSGDHGIIATIPLAAVAEKMNIEEERLARAIALSYLVTIYIKEYSGRLSAFCGCAVAAGTGVSAGTVYLLGGSNKQIEYTINNMAANITGMICDGGNLGCSLKAVTAANAAIMSALISIKDVYIPNNSGIVGNTVEDTMKNIGKVASPGMIETDNVILDTMLER
ncbi:L-serine ammonia-lyase, iron-sulfur-dependent, subunit alpha [Clostridium aestuarii]|uniref:UPF0597 protein OW763_11490 n=1 Tax=Clostridium aestuarii TaxID=338193 RepID=A0ABT4D146_9CLOT|nr:L-serine ammonia-lyase, iron-sulfur-dependent, subunit alpha [Clostridium aestuarii]MCY6484966.1 L-serine ammonia-lyase, iron-sulfur-dependent, subunit alpha [Clostridium aestuarii]